MWWTAAHNEYLELLCEVGIAGGLLALAGAAAWLMRAGRPGLFRGRSDRHLYAGMAAGLAGLMAHSAVSPHLQVPALGLVFALTTAFTLRMALNREAAGPHHGSQPQRLLKAQGAGARRALLAGLTIAAALNSLSGAFRIAGFLDQHRGERALAEARLNDAYDSILEASRWMPGNPTPWVFLARVLQHAQANGIPLDAFEGSSTMETFGAGVGYLARAIALNPADGWSWYNLANNYQGIRTARNRLERMRAAGERASGASEPPAAQEPTKKGRLDPEDRISVAAMLQAVEREPESYVYPDALAKLYWDRGLAEAASDQIRASLTLTPRLKAHAVLEAPGLLAGLEGAILEGIERAGEGEFSGPVMRARARAEILQRLGRLDEAAAAYGELRELAGSDLAAECDLAVGKIHLQQDRYREAATHLERAAAAGAGDPHGVAALFHLGAAVARLGEHERAVDLFRRYLNLRPDTMGAYFGLADSLEALGLHEEAERTLVGAVRRFPSDGTAYMRIIHHLRTRGRPGEALLYAEGLGKVEPGDERVQQLIAELRRESGRRPR
ncbi:MAG TPA: tetratricopeptide repeat protein, partial [Candidatus Polarisedimenticolia bacterium]|nr:tetratricopeptide repeat protein [Candidatus Polarisedimenticolia bacterium]